MKYPIAVASWSLGLPTLREMFDQVGRLKLSGIQLGLVEQIDFYQSQETMIRESGVPILGTTVVHWTEDYSTLESIRRTGGFLYDYDARFQCFKERCIFTRDLGLRYLSVHAGFLPADRCDERFQLAVKRLREVLKVAADNDVLVGFETGQETAETLLMFLEELNHSNARVNFDPANMIMYRMGDPIEALRQLAPYVENVHAKDAKRSVAQGEWGREVALGTGDVDYPALLQVLQETGFAGNLIIEREAGETRFEDIASGRDHLLTLMAGERAAVS